MCLLENVKHTITYLAVAENDLTSLTLDNFRALKKLYAFRNALTEVTFYGRSSLKQISLNSNDLTEAPYLHSMKNKLTIYNMDRNRLSVVRNDSWTYFQRLEILELDENTLSAFPCSAVKGTSLRALNLRGNRLVELPRLDCVSSTLRELDLSSNKISLIVNEQLEDMQITSLKLGSNKFSILHEVYILLSELTYQGEPES